MGDLDDLLAELREFAEDTLSEDSLRTVARDHEGTFAFDAWRACADFGILGWAVPPDHGGSGLGASAVVRLMEMLGRHCRDNGLTFALGAQMWGIQSAILEFGTPEQIAHYLPRLLSGRSVAAYAITERGSGSDAFGLETTAQRTEGGYRLNGEKVLISFAPIADFALVFGKTDPSAGRWGITAFLVDADTPGYVAHPVEHKMGLRTVPFGRISLEDCEIPEERRLGPEGAGASIFTTSQAWERSLVLAPQVGAMARQLDECVAEARNRSRGGRPIGSHQAISHRIADMKMRLDLSRLLLYRTADLLEEGRSTLMETAVAKAFLSEAFVESSRDAISIFGGEGYKTDTEVERDLRDALAATIYGGTADVQRNIVAGLLGLPS
ncbi:MAG: acyl-CoA dehydrogenase [Gemmatimonadetes bacterium]|nr:acyl-CoA dehydrogenase [Gemmatimonadota bacterium]